MPQTSLANSIDAAGQKARYDAVAKKLVGHKVILAQILRECVDEFRNVPVSMIMQECFVGEPQVNTVAVDPDAPPASRQKEDAHTKGNVETLDSDSWIIGANTEDTSTAEGVITYDIRFTVKIPGKFDLIHLIINIEIQVVAKPGYAVEKRGIYYCARLISAQKGTVFSHKEYNKIQKVYSIWICPDPLKRNQNSMIEYGITPQKVIGAARPTDYDLLKMVIINLNDDGMKDAQGIIRLLSTLLSVKEAPEKKKQILREEFHIAMEKELEEEMKEMCNLSDGVMELGRTEGREQGENKLASLMAKLFSLNRAKDAEKAATDPEYREKLYVEFGIA